jgi:hypothetical protein
MAIQQLDLGAVYNTLAQKRSQDLQAQQFAQQGQMNALQMARYQRENDASDRKQSALAIFNDPNATPDAKRSALGAAYPELAAQAAYAPKNSFTYSDGMLVNTTTGEIKPVDGAGYTDINGNPVGGMGQPRVQLASAGSTTPPMPGQRTYSEAVKAVENTTGNPNAKNPNSSATGDGQFIESTWLDMINRKAPGLAQGKSREEILAMRSDPELSAKMTEEYALDNQRIFERNGIQATPALLYGAHHFGAGAAVKFAKAPDETPMEAILGEAAIKANPHLAGVTVGQAKARLNEKFSGAAMPGQQPQQQPQVTPAAPNTTGGAISPLVRNGKVVPGWGVDANGQTVPTGNNTTVNVDTKGDTKEAETIGAARGKQYEGVMTRATAAQDTINQVRLGRALADTDAEGKELPTVLQNKAGAAVTALGLDPESPMVKALLGRVTDGQSFNGVMMQLVLNKQTQQAGPQTDKDAENIKATLASLGNTPQARDFLLRTAEAQSQRDIDKLAFYDKFMETNNGSTKGAEVAWNKHVNSFPLFGVNPSSKKPVFYQEFQAAVHEANPDASEEDVLGLWRSKYGKSR